jgi:hypothetical protein
VDRVFTLRQRVRVDNPSDQIFHGLSGDIIEISEDPRDTYPYRVEFSAGVTEFFNGTELK